MGRLIKQTPLTFTRYGESDTDEDTGYSIDVPDSIIEAEGSLQPLGAGDAQKIKAEGVDTYAAYKYYTTTHLQNTDTIARTQADTTIVDGREYEVFDDGNWNKTVLRRVAHYKVILVRVSKQRGN